MDMIRMIPEIDFDELAKQNEESQEITTGYLTPLYDFINDDFVRDHLGRIVTDSDLIGMKSIIEKAHKTARNAYDIYSDSYGSEEEAALREQAPEKIKQMLVKKAIREAIIYDDRINDISSIELERIKDGYFARYTVYTIFGEIPVEREVF